NAFLSRERAESEQNRLLKAQQDLQELTNKYTAELAQKQQEMNTKLTQKVMAFIQEFNKEKGYNFIFSNTMNDNILFAEKGADITEELLLGLNEAYVAEKEKK
ncbi:MAG TPA: hypothetical protein DDY68_00370, partial [Porphyromonadaceae bacterium]|nr:hypothetical protein [Porphyromonadaceae bacterium]